MPQQAAGVVLVGTAGVQTAVRRAYLASSLVPVHGRGQATPGPVWYDPST